MDLNWARVLFTVCVFVSFMVMLLIVFNRRNRSNYDNVAQSIVDDPDTPNQTAQSSHENGA